MYFDAKYMIMYCYCAVLANKQIIIRNVFGNSKSKTLSNATFMMMAVLVLTVVKRSLVRHFQLV